MDWHPVQSGPLTHALCCLGWAACDPGLDERLEDGWMLRWLDNLYCD